MTQVTYSSFAAATDMFSGPCAENPPVGMSWKVSLEVQKRPHPKPLAKLSLCWADVTEG